MHLKKMEMYGFKSFADRTEIVFDPGVTGIVGPNGCGKSNVVDSIKWCLGSMSPKALRGSEMMDVIFGGSERRPALGMAEVSLTFGNDRGVLPVEYDEVTITRRLFRSGESEYLLNKQPCRLRDIRELFMDTGVGTDSYSIIEQGKIGALLQSSPKDRRLVFEEAAGISKFKSRKKEAESKLERVSQDLLRIGDVLKELQSRVRSLKIQAGRAEKYRALSDEIRVRKRDLALHCFGALVTQRAELTTRAVELQAAHAVAAGELTSLRAQLGEFRTREQETDRQLQGRRSELASRESQIAQAEERLHNDAHHVEEMGRLRAKRHEELETARRRADEARGRDEEARRQLGAVTEEMAVLDRQMAELQQEHGVLEAACRTLAGQVEALKAEALDLVHRQARTQNDLNAVVGEQRTLAARRERVAARRAQIGQELAGLVDQRTRRADERETLELEIADLKRQNQETDAEAREVTRKLNALRERVGALRDRETALASRHQLLTDLENHYEGLQAGVVRVLEGIRAGEPALHGVRGVLADLIRVEREHIPIVDAVLEGREDVLVAETLTSARSAVAFARAAANARVSALAADQARVPDWFGAGVEEIPGVVGRANQFVDTDDADRPLVEWLFGDTLVVESLDIALTLLHDYHVTFPMVTRTGERVDPKGIVTGGPSGEAMTLLSRKAEMRDLERDVMNVRTELHAAEEERNSVADWIQNAEKRAQQLRTMVYEKSLLSAEKKTEIDALDRKRSLLVQEEDVAGTEELDMENQAGDLQQREQILQGTLAGTVARIAEVEVAQKDAEARRAEEDARRAAVWGRITEHRIQQAQSREQRKHLEETMRGLEREVRELEERILATEEIIADADEKVAGIERGAAARREQLAVLHRERSEYAGQAESLAAELDDLRAQGLAAFQQEQDVARRVREQEEQMSSARVEESTVQVRIETVVQRTQDELGCNLETEYPQYQDDAARDWDAFMGEIKEMQDSLAKLGNVNLSALDELKESEDRANYLAAQEKDLVDSKGQLEELIKKINKDSRDLFVETVQRVRENFGMLFRKLFGGGRADIILEDNVDILEAGVEIMARPPGKELTSISLLSGGEKALTALALIMGIFMLKPSPFCVLDEVDAPLDEQNVHRFLSLIKEFAQTTQFLLITHNKVSMAATDVIYGVTMEEKGVSKKISVKLIEEQIPALV